MNIETGIILNNTRLSEYYYLADIHLPSMASRARPGQFLLVQAQANTTSPLLKIPLAVYDKTDESLMVLYRIRGQKTQRLCQKSKGTSIEVLGPLGNSFDWHGLTHTVILIAGGCGIASLQLLAKRLRSKNIEVVVLSGARCKDELVEVKRFEALGCTVMCATDDGSEGFKGNVIDLFLAQQRRYAQFQVCASGPESMLRHIASLAKAYSFEAQLSFESYMACGIGVCRGCAVDVRGDYKLCCQDGPIFKAKDIL
jgi:dihydroorotate dehydrogenase electron transfer subunit